MRIAAALLVAMISVLVAFEVGEGTRFTLEMAIAFLMLVFIQGWLLQRAFSIATGEAPRYAAACSACAMAMFCGAMLTLLLTFILMAALADKAKDLPFITLPIISFFACIGIYWALTLPRFCSWRLSIEPPPRAAGVLVAIVMSAIQQLLYVSVWGAMVRVGSS